MIHLVLDGALGEAPWAGIRGRVKIIVFTMKLRTGKRVFGAVPKSNFGCSWRVALRGPNVNASTSWDHFSMYVWRVYDFVFIMTRSQLARSCVEHHLVYTVFIMLET